MFDSESFHFSLWCGRSDRYSDQYNCSAWPMSLSLCFNWEKKVQMYRPLVQTWQWCIALSVYVKRLVGVCEYFIWGVKIHSWRMLMLLLIRNSTIKNRQCGDFSIELYLIMKLEASITSINLSPCLDDNFEKNVLTGVEGPLPFYYKLFIIF